MSQVEKIAAVVTGHPLGGLWLMECSECGPVGIAPELDADSAAFDHLTDIHGAEAVTS